MIEAVIEVGQRAVILHVTEAIEAVPAEAPELDRILAAVAAHLEVVLTLSQYASASVRNFGQLPQDMRERQMVHRLEYAAIWRDLFNKSAAQGDFGPVLDTSIARMLIMGALSWTPEWWDPERGSLDEIVASAQQLVRRGLSAAILAHRHKALRRSPPPASRKTAPPASRKTAPPASRAAACLTKDHTGVIKDHTGVTKDRTACLTKDHTGVIKDHTASRQDHRQKVASTADLLSGR